MSTFSSDNRWCASVRASVQLRTGCNPLEKHGPQAVDVHVHAFAPFSAISNPHEIKNVIDYEHIFLAIRALENQPHHECLESSIMVLMAAIFDIPLVDEVDVSMEKPHIYKGLATPAIRLCLNRMAWESRLSSQNPR